MLSSLSAHKTAPAEHRIDQNQPAQPPKLATGFDLDHTGREEMEQRRRQGGPSMLRAFNHTRLVHALATGLSVCCLSACSDQQVNNRTAVNDGPEVSERATGRLPLRIPISAVMTGAINRASNRIFRTATLLDQPSEADWLELGEAAVELVGAATLVTIEGTGPSDNVWVADSRWRGFSAEMQSAALAAGAAASSRSRAALTEAAARLAQSCQSCHLAFSTRLITTPN
jgi:hypothetical protein